MAFCNGKKVTICGRGGCWKRKQKKKESLGTGNKDETKHTHTHTVTHELFLNGRRTQSREGKRTGSPSSH